MDCRTLKNRSGNDRGKGTRSYGESRDRNDRGSRLAMTSVSQLRFDGLKVVAVVKYNTCVCGERSPVVKAPGCGPGDRGFKSHRSPQFVFAPIAQRTEHRSSEPRVVGSNPSRRAMKRWIYDVLPGLPEIRVVRGVRVFSLSRLSSSAH